MRARPVGGHRCRATQCRRQALPIWQGPGRCGSVYKFRTCALGDLTARAITRVPARECLIAVTLQPLRHSSGSLSPNRRAGARWWIGLETASSLRLEIALACLKGPQTGWGSKLVRQAANL
jgi:hypothetical protein